MNTTITTSLNPAISAPTLQTDYFYFSNNAAEPMGDVEQEALTPLRFPDDFRAMYSLALHLAG